MRKGEVEWLLVFLLVASCAAQVQPSQNVTSERAFPGNLRLLPGFVHHRGRGMDSFVGTIIGANGLEIQYDIGTDAGVYTDCQTCGWTDGELWRKKQVINGQEVRMVFTKKKRLVISFPGANANFYATVRSDSDLTDTLLIVLTYRPIGQ